MQFSIIAALDKRRGIGKAGTLPWRLKGDMEYFRSLTVGTGDAARPNVVIMGRTTWESIPEKVRPLPQRLNVVLSTKQLVLPEGVDRATSLDEVLTWLGGRLVGEVFIIGGASVYAQAIVHPACKTLYLTEIDSEFECDAFFPELPLIFVRTAESAPVVEHGVRYRYVTYQRNA